MNDKCSHNKKLQGEDCLQCEKIWHEYWIKEHAHSLERHKKKLDEVNKKLKQAPPSHPPRLACSSSRGAWK
jgi:hypothetical protein